MLLGFYGLSTVFTAILCASILMTPASSSSAFDERNIISDSNRALISWTKFTVKYKDRIILNLTASGSILHGRVLGILGPSGSGKTTFLNALTGGLDASVSFSGEMHSSDGNKLISEKIAFIYQEDSFFSQLTVRETLQLAASLRLYDFVSQSLINEIIHYLALTHVADSLVGDIISRGISGGERKRLAVGCEMLGTAPSLLVADEPSSGLDSFQAKQVVLLLRKIAVEKNIAVVCTIHQPRSSIWGIFDDILLLAPGGLVIYHGPRDQALAYFASIGHHCPPYTNPAEFLIDLVSFDQQSPKASSERIKSLSEAFSASKSYAVSLVGPMTELPTLILEPTLPTTLWRGPRRAVFRFLILLKRALRQTLRDNATNVTRLAVSSVLAALLGGMYGGQGKVFGSLDSNTVANRVNLIAHASINVGMLSMVKALQLFKRERAVVDRERSLGRYSAVEYLAAKLCAELPFDAIVGATFGYIAHNRGQLQSNSHIFAGVLALVSCVTSSLGLAVGASFPTGDMALAIGPALMVVYVILGAIGPAGGGTELPFFLRPLQQASPIRWACEALCASELRGRALTRGANVLQSQKVFKLSFGNFSAKSFRNYLFGGLHMLGSSLRGLGEILLKVGVPRKKKRIGTEGPVADRTLAILDIPDASITKSTIVLGQMLVVHILVAWMGLFFNKPKRS